MAEALAVERVDFITIPTRGEQRARSFYRDVLGLPVDTNNPEELTAGQVTLCFWEPEKEGIETIQDLRREFPETKIIAMTGRESLTDYDVFQVARTLGAVKTLKKPFKLDELVAVVKELSPG